MPKLNQKGFSMIEVIVVIGLMSILMLIAGYYMGNRGDKAQLKSAARDLVSNMTLARIRAIRDTTPWAMKFDSGSNSYTIYQEPGEDFAPEDPADPVHWNDGDETVFRTIALPAKVSFGNAQTDLPGPEYAAGGDGISYDGYVDPDGTPVVNLIIFEPNGTCSENGAVYLTIPGGETFSVSNLAATGRIKALRNYGSGWTN